MTPKQHKTLKRNIQIAKHVLEGKTFKQAGELLQVSAHVARPAFESVIWKCRAFVMDEIRKGNKPVSSLRRSKACPKRPSCATGKIFKRTL